ANYYRKARKHGAIATRPGISNEYICVCTSVDIDNNSTAIAVNRAVPSKEEIIKVYGNKVANDMVLLCDGNKVYEALDEKCIVAHKTRINRANSFHSFIKERLRHYRGVATIYLNRYNALFSEIFAKEYDTLVNKIFSLITIRTGSFLPSKKLSTKNLLLV
ncbi:MAG: hypothetical protein LBU04_07575, partial [Christensenellaceae bacterium]|nr:hypothetical protein [Christensenellaceae bacterium]